MANNMLYNIFVQYSCIDRVLRSGYTILNQYKNIEQKILYNISLTIEILFIYFILHYIFLRFEI